MTNLRENANWLLPAIATLFIWGVWAFLPKLALQDGMPPHSVIFYESLGNFIVALPVIAFLKFRLRAEGRMLLALGAVSVLTVFGILSYVTALHAGPVAVIATMTALYPLICLLLARVVLKERINALQGTAIVLALCSALLLLLPA